MAAFFTLPELRSELHSLGHDDVPDHVILAFLSQLQITVPNCFKSGPDRSPSDPSRPASSYLEPDDHGAAKNHQVHNKNATRMLGNRFQNRGFEQDTFFNRQGNLENHGQDRLHCEDRFLNPQENQENLQFFHSESEEQARFVRFDELQLQEELFSSKSCTRNPLGRPSTPPRRSNPVIAYSSDSDASKENNRGRSLKDSSHSSSSRQVLQPRDNLTFDEQKAPYMYPGDILAELKNKQRPVSCPMFQEPHEEIDQIRSFSAPVFHLEEEQQHRRHHRLLGQARARCQEQKRSDYQSGSVSEVQSVSSLEVEEEIEGFLKPLNLGVVRHSIKTATNSASTSDECTAETTDGERPSSRGSIRSNCAACQLLKESGTPKFRHFSMKKQETDGEESGGSTPRTFIEREPDSTKSPSPALHRRGGDPKSISPSLSDLPLTTGNKKTVVRRGKIDRVARFAEMQKLWNKDHFLKATSGKRKTQSFHRMFAEIHASNERVYAASRARWLLQEVAVRMQAHSVHPEEVKYKNTGVLVLATISSMRSGLTEMLDFGCN